MSLAVGLATCYLVIFTGKRTWQFFMVKFVSLTAINMYLLPGKVLYNGRRAKIVLHNNLPYLSTKIRRYQQEPGNGA